MKKRIQNIIYDMIPVILGIFIALWAENIRADFDNREKLDEIIKLVSKETKENISELKKSLVHNQAVKETLKKYLNDSEISLNEILKLTSGLRLPLIKSYTPTLLYGLNSKDKIENWELISTISENQEAIQIVKNRGADLTNLDFISMNKIEKQKLDFILSDILYDAKIVLKNFNSIDSLVKKIKR